MEKKKKSSSFTLVRVSHGGNIRWNSLPVVLPLLSYNLRFLQHAWFLPSISVPWGFGWFSHTFAFVLVSTHILGCSSPDVSCSFCACFKKLMVVDQPRQTVHWSVVNFDGRRTCLTQEPHMTSAYIISREVYITTLNLPLGLRINPKL